MDKNYGIFIDAYLNGGCIVCGKEDRGGLPFGHLYCWEDHVVRNNLGPTYARAAQDGLRKATLLKLAKDILAI